MSAHLEARNEPADALTQMLVKAPPYVAERLEGTLDRIRAGHSLGHALRLTGFDWPDRQVIQRLVIQSDADNFDARVFRLARNWVARTVRDVQSRSKRLNTVLLLLVVASIAMAMLSLYSVQDQATARMDSLLWR